jgi:gamma-glutamyl phosphate reductase
MCICKCRFRPSRFPDAVTVLGGNDTAPSCQALVDVARRSREAANVMQSAPLAARNAALGHIKLLLKANEDEIIAANKRDCEDSAKDGIAQALAKV